MIIIYNYLQTYFIPKGELADAILSDILLIKFIRNTISTHTKC